MCVHVSAFKACTSSLYETIRNTNFWSKQFVIDELFHQVYFKEFVLRIISKWLDVQTLTNELLCLHTDKFRFHMVISIKQEHGTVLFLCSRKWLSTLYLNFQSRQVMPPRSHMKGGLSGSLPSLFKQTLLSFILIMWRPGPCTLMTLSRVATSAG